MQLSHLLPDDHPLRSMTTEAQANALRQATQEAHEQYLKVKYLKNVNTKYFRRYQQLKAEYDTLVNEA